ncbi:MAG: amylase [Pseudomonadota bacterium]
MTEAPTTAKRRYWLGGNRHDAQDRFFREALDPALWEPGDATAWEACWYTGMPKAEAFEALDGRKWANHIPGNNALTVKSRLAATLAATRDRLLADEGPDGEGPQRMGFFPETFAMPRHYHAFQAAALAEPEARWILKPKNASKGRDIRLVEDPATVPTGDRWMVQRYLHEPHTIRGHKYVLRLYVLITSVEPLRVYLYHEGFAKLASEPYDLNDPSNVFSHLTNPDINETNTAVASPVVFIPFRDYRAWLRDQGHDDAALFERVHDLVTLTAIAAREPLRQRLAEVQADTSGCYELLGIDCLIDARLKPWIMECNLNPSLDVCAAPEDGGEVEFAIKRQLVHDLVAMLGLNQPQPAHPGLEGEARLVAEAAAELAHAGGWQRLLPHPEPERHLPFFTAPRLADVVLADAVAGRRVHLPTFCRHRAAEIVEPDHLALYAEDEGVLYHPNPTATWLWLHATAGLDPDDLAERLAAERGAGDAATRRAVRAEVWAQLADWAAAGLIRQTRGTEVPAHAAAPRPAPIETTLHVGLGDATVSLGLRSAPVVARLDGLWARASVGAEPVTHLEVIETRRGYGLVQAGRSIADDLALAEVAPAIVAALLSTAAPHGTLTGAVLCPPSASTGILVAPGPVEASDAPAFALARALKAELSGGLRLDALPTDPCRPLGLPARVPLGHAGVRHRHRWPDGREAGLVPTRPAPALPIAAVLVPTTDLAADDASLVPLSPARTLAALLPGLRGAEGGRPSAADVSRLHAWLESRPGFAVPADRPAAVAAALHLWLRREPTGEKLAG